MNQDRNQSLNSEAYSHLENENDQNLTNLIHRDQSIPPRHGLLSKSLFLWVYDTIKKGMNKTLKEEDLPPLDEKMCSSENYRRFEASLNDSKKEYINAESKKKQIFLIKLFYGVFKRQVQVIFLLAFGAAVAVQLEPFLTIYILKAYQEPRDVENLIIGVAFFIFFVAFKVLADIHLSFQESIMGLKMFGSFSSAIMNKILNLSINQKEKYTLGDLQNLLQIDIQQANQFYKSIMNLAMFPIRLIFCIIIYYSIVGNRATVGLFTSFAQFFINISLGKIYQNFQIEYMKAKDERMNVLDEILSGIKTIKLEAYHCFFSTKISQKRKNEAYLALKKNLFGLIFSFSGQFFYILNLVLCVKFYDISSISDLLLITSNYSALSKLLEGLQQQIVSLIIAHSSFIRLQNLLYEESNINQNIYKQLLPSNKSDDQSILLQNISFKYAQSQDNQLNQPEDQFILKIDEFSVKKGQIIAVIGPTGSGKSMLLQSLVQETQIQKNNNIETSSFYVSEQDISIATQNSWVMKGTIRDNIIFGSQFNFDPERYREVLQSTQIIQDIEHLPLHDLTSVSERGDSLSGGQKRRVNLARTVYRGGELFLLDDVLTGLDSQVTRQVMTECINGPLMKNTTRILFQSNLNYLNSVDKIYILNEGQILKVGSYLEISNSPFYQQLSQNYLGHFNDDLQDQDSQENQIQEQKNNNNQSIQPFQMQFNQNGYGNILQNSEDQREGKVESWVYKKVFQLYGGCCTAIIFVILGLVSTFFQMQQFNILKSGKDESQSNDNQNEKINDNQNNEESDDFTSTMIKFLIFLVLTQFFDILKTFVFCFKNYTFCKDFHEDISKSLLNASYSEFYSSYPTGVLSNRLSNDIMSVDQKVYELLNPILSILFGCLGIFFVFLSVKLGSLYIVNIIAIIMWVYLTKIYTQVQREINRIETVSKSPILNYFSEIYRGTLYIKQCVDHSIPVKEFQQFININLRNQIVSSAVQNLFMFLILFIVILFECTLFIIMFYETSVSGEKLTMVLITAINFGMLVMYALLVWSIFETEAGIKIERCCKLAYQIPQENGSPFAVLSQQQQNNSEMLEIQHNAIQAKQASFGIKNNNLELIKNLNFTVTQREKIGIVGRTGAGKTSLTNGLTSLFELINGELFVNGKPIKAYEAYDLRQIFSVIPQEPFVFEGTLKENIDPSQNYNNSQIQNVYDQLNLQEHYSFKSGLNSRIFLKGVNLSAGEKQLISISRCLLKNSSIILIDEATSCLDQQTEKKITDLVAEKLQDKTILTVAHKLNTVLQSNRIFVINQGQLIEQGEPQALLAQKNNSTFYKMLKRFIE
ncbi:ATP-binding ABC transporter (macronuclear) [Tetrahymena thermophila SB210]|uniref:ATP-binding ABC transporter n=1 Tax=Tetrahymena thermophila (strain SB210) TaxID=312017 RepID=Q22KG9_TETTS|nr:ATP-binding ABC transporter [Tetrahymena thermophila SB210]EAR85830.3 ATP-binding ABC transporter [Tetrahymena thermophila SB210]|eukprot:XP_001033493.3 ATP-binding ABC transporter [Tetrahymena thermophila SB210]